MPLDLESLRKAILSLKQTISVSAEMMAQRPEDEALANALRAGVIQNIEFTYELSWNASVARDVALIAPGLLAEAEKLLAAIEGRNA